MEIRKRPAGDAVLAVVAAFLTAAVTVVYALVILQQGDAGESRPRFVAASLLFASFALLAAIAVRRVPLRLLLLSAGSFTLVIWTVLGAMSIGALLLPGTVIALVAAARAGHRVPLGHAWTAVAAGVVTSVALAWLGLVTS